MEIWIPTALLAQRFNAVYWQEYGAYFIISSEYLSVIKGETLLKRLLLTGTWRHLMGPNRRVRWIFQHWHLFVVKNSKLICDEVQFHSAQFGCPAKDLVVFYVKNQMVIVLILEFYICISFGSRSFGICRLRLCCFVSRSYWKTQVQSPVILS
jgi:hypothetical protein